MTRIVGIHGIHQHVKGPETLAQQWTPALRDGITLAGSVPPEPADMKIAFYGDLFRKSRAKGLGDPRYTAADLNDPAEVGMLQLMWEEASRTDSAVPSPSGRTKLRTPMLVQRALNAVSQSAFFAGLGEQLTIGIIKQVCAYLTNDDLRTAIQQRVTAAVDEDIRVIVGHSLGSVVAYEAVCAHPEWPVSLVTLGSPLGIRNVVLDRLRPAPVNGVGIYPTGIHAWTNVADDGDVVALVKQLATVFGPHVTDEAVRNGAKPHDVSPYLTAVETGRAISAGLAR